MIGIKDDYEIITKDSDVLEAEISEMENKSEWLSVKSKSLTLCAVEKVGPLCKDTSSCLDEQREETEEDTMTSGTGLYLTWVDEDGKGKDSANRRAGVFCDEKTITYGEVAPIEKKVNVCNAYLRDTAKRGVLYKVAGIGGDNLQRLNNEELTKAVNLFLTAESVRDKGVLLLLRCGKINAAVSAAEYEYLPISKLIKITKGKLRSTFDEIDFVEGRNTFDLTTCLWSLPKAKEKIMRSYKDAVKKVINPHFDPDFLMPAVRFSSSDTSAGCASLCPVFISGKTEYRFIEGIKIKHSVVNDGSEKTGLDRFAEAADNLYSLFEDNFEQIKKLAEIYIENGENCVVSLCNKYDISKKYGDPVRNIVASYTVGGQMISAYDIFMCMSDIPRMAETLPKTTSTTVAELAEKVGRIVKADWSLHDVGGCVNWK